MIVNIYEEIVQQKSHEILQQLGMCECDACLDDLCALTLNKLGPKYVATTGGAVFSQLSANTEQGQAEIMTALYTAAKIIRKNPRHPTPIKGGK